MTGRIRIEGRTLGGDIVADFVLAHGGDPSQELRDRGWAMTGVEHAFTLADDAEVRVRCTVVAELPKGEGRPAWRTGPTQEMVPEDVEPLVVQRLAAYAVVVHDNLTLLTRLSAAVRGAAHAWTLPGGGVEEGEDPATGLRREVWEETGQHLGELCLLDLVTSHWVGQSPDGVWEDYQVVRLVYAATVPDPVPLVVHDVGGTTAEAAWLDIDTIAEPDRAPLLTGSRWVSWRRDAVAGGPRGPRPARLSSPAG